MKIVRLSAFVVILILLIFVFKNFVSKNDLKVEKSLPTDFSNIEVTNKNVDLNNFKIEDFKKMNIDYSNNYPIKTSGFVNQIYTATDCSNIKIFPFPFLIEILKNKINFYALERHTNENTVFTKIDNPIQISLENINSCKASQDEFENTIIDLRTNGNNLTIFVNKGLPFIKVDFNSDLNIKINGKNLGIKKLTEKSYYIFNRILVSDQNQLPTTYPKVSYKFLKNENNYFQEININPASPFVLLPHHQSTLYVERQNVGHIFKSVKGDVYSVVTDKVIINLGSPVFQESFTNPINTNNGILKQLESDLEQIGDEPFADNSSSYWNGKKLFKLSNLLLVSHYLNEQDYVNRLINILKSELSDYFTYSGELDKKYFIYYKNIGALQNSKPDFGHEYLNDTHFHFGYYIYASSILCKFDLDFCNKHKSVVESLINSVASYSSNDKFPYLRHLSLYDGHSFASGLTKSGDGNNQESSSEAINFWYSAYLFNKQINKNADIYLASYLLESLSAKTYYLNYYNSSLYDKEYKHKIFSIVWEGKNDFATWFSANPKAIYGIQFIPLSAGSSYLKTPNYKEKVTDLENEERIYNKDEPMFDDLILGYKLINEKIDDKSIISLTNVDSSNSKSWMLFLNSTLSR